MASSPVLRGCRVLPSTPAGDRQGGRCMRRSRVSGLYPRPALLAHPPPSDLPSPEILGSGNFFFLQEKKNPTHSLQSRLALPRSPHPHPMHSGSRSGPGGFQSVHFPTNSSTPWLFHRTSVVPSVLPLAQEAGFHIPPNTFGLLRPRLCGPLPGREHTPSKSSCFLGQCHLNPYLD